MASIIDEFSYDVFLSFRGEDTRYGFTGNLKKALDDKGHVANLSGFHYKKGEMYEHEFIGKIVEEVLKKITVGITLHVGDYLVGLEPKKQRVISLLNVGSDDTVHMVGIHGIGGIGKTTLALEIYNSIIHQFQCSCFLKVRENYHKNGLELQKILLSHIVKKNIDINSVEEGISILRKMLSKKKVLLILDDVDSEKQLQAIAGKSNWFGLGSRVIITTRNQRLLTLHGVERTYEVKELNKKDAFELVRWNAFKNEKTDKVFSEEFSIQNYLGEFTSNKSVGFLSKLKILRIISCRVIKSVPPLDCPSLIELDLSNCSSLESFPLTVNGFVGNLKILRLTKCSKIRIIPLNMLHSLEELNLNDCTSLESFSHVVGWGKKLKTMSIRSCYKLRSIPTLKLSSLEELDLSNCTSLQNFPSVANEFLGKLKILRVENCHNLKSIPPLKLDVLEELDLSNCYMLKSFLLSVGEFLGKVKTMRLAHCHNIKSIPPLKLDSLEKLDLSNCTSLESFSHVVGLGEKLKTMSVRSCFKLRIIPPLKLTSLEELDLSYCTSLESFPLVVDEFLGKLKILLVENCHNLKSIPPLKLYSLEELDLSFCYSLESFPSVVDGLLDKLKFLNIEHCIMLRSIPPLRLTLLEKFNLSYCLSLESFPEILGEITNIPRILLYETPIKQLPFPFQHLTPPPTSYPCRCGIVHLPNRVAAMSMLAEFTIKGEGKVSPMQSSHVEYICLRNCKLSDEYLSTSLMLFAKEIKGIPPSLRMLSALNCQSLTSSSKSKLLNQELHEVGNTWFRLPRAKIPEWFDHQCSEGLSISFWFRNKFPDILLCVGSPLTWFPNHQHRITKKVKAHGRKKVHNCLNAERGKQKESPLMCFQPNVINTTVHKISPPCSESPDWKIVSVLIFCSEDFKSFDSVSLLQELCLDILKVQENRYYSQEKINQNEIGVDASDDNPSSLVELVNVIDSIFCSVKRTSITKEELLITMNCLDFVEISEAGEAEE
ncbi:disease resistance protein RPV1 [Trifolium repens]|nr:disease resistance protein RPV1 [Trifolium repens]